jgi:ribosomal protein S18 acetylase RimI-like enzyme
VEAVIRRVRPDEGPVLEAVRLAALADSPSAFGSSHAAEADRGDAHWEARAVLGAAGESSVTFLAVVGGSVVGLVGAHHRDAGGRSVELVSMWVAPAQRRGGIAAELVDAAVGWAREAGATAVELWVTRGNDAAVRLYETAGFRLTGDHQPLPSDRCKDELRMRRVVG